MDKNKDRGLDLKDLKNRDKIIKKWRESLCIM